jgi:hypothetical protein
MGRNQNNNPGMFEALESRLMMSAAPLQVEAAAVKKAAPVKVIVAVAPKIVKTIDPTTTEIDITYKSFASDPLFGTDGPTASDINQGYLGDCYLLSTLSSVARTDPALIRKDIVADENGVFTVTFGKSTKINVNADLPVWPDGQVAYAGLGQQDSLWVALMEKAYVLYTSPKTDAYNSISGGWMSSAFSALNLKSQTIETTASATALLSGLQADLKAGDFTTFGTLNTLPTGSPLVAGHAYEVDSVTDDASGNPISVTFRNPWGSAVADDGLVTLTANQAYTAFAGVVISHA